jgi:hypothetical protein
MPINLDNKMTPTSDTEKTPTEPLFSNLHATSMCTLEQLASGTSKTQQATAIIDNLVYLQQLKTKKKMTQSDKLD